MRRIQILDCTMRDGGYCNEWEFGKKNINKIVKGLANADIDIVEYGFLTNKVVHKEGNTRFNHISQVEKFLPEKKNHRMHVVMINFGEYDVADLPAYEADAPVGIRVAFHKKDMIDALKMCKQIKDKGYSVFVQPMVSLSYSDEEYLKLLQIVNSIEPYAFYIVDSFGMMKQKDLIRLFYMVEHNLKENIFIGFHSHNNMQLAYSNAQTLVEIQTKKKIIIDSSVFGMGRGAGNLNTELFVEYLNGCRDENYTLEPLLQIMDEVINEFYVQKPWGYSLPNYLSASYNCHPNYADYLDSKHTLTIGDINNIFSMMDEKMKVNFDSVYIEGLYQHYMEHNAKEKEDKIEFLEGKEILLIASGVSAESEKEKIMQFVQEKDCVTIAINFEYKYLDTDYIFVSNSRRYRELEQDVNEQKLVITSNVQTPLDCLQVSYEKLLNSEDGVRDNSGLMLMKLLLNSKVKKLYIAGIDGYTCNQKENYINNAMSFKLDDNLCEQKNNGLSKVISMYAKEVEIEWVTTQRYVAIEMV